MSRFLISMLLLTGCATSAFGSTTAISFSTQVEAFAEPVSIDAFTSGWHDELRPGDDAALHARAELRADDGPWHVAWRWRYDYQLEFSPATAELHHRIQNGLPVQPGRAYPLNIDAYHIERHGPAVGYRFDLTPVQLALSLNLYQGLQLIEGATRGNAAFASAQADGDQVNDLFAQIDYRYSEPQLQEEELDWAPDAPEGWGYGLDVDVNWRLKSGATLQLHAEDLFAEMHWQDVPGTTVTARCDCTIPAYDVIGGLYIRESHRQRLKPYVHFAALQPIGGDWQLGARVLSDTWLTTRQFGVEHLWRNIRAGLWYEPDYRAWRFSYGHPNASLSWTADSVDTSDAYRLGIALSLAWRW